MQQSISIQAEKPSIINSSPLVPESFQSNFPLIESDLDDVISVIEGAGDILSGFLAQSIELRERLRSGRLYLAVLGQFKRGKSTFINALIQKDILPTSVIPATAVPTYIDFGAQARAKVIFFNGTEEAFECPENQPLQLREFLSRYVTEKLNPHNREGVERVVLSYPSDVLHGGIMLIDTPGIGSTHTHNTEATLRFLPQCDAAFIILSPDPPVTDVEISFYRDVASRVSKIFVVINKMDLVSAEELHELTSFISSVLHSEAGFSEGVTILPLSAREALSNPDSEVHWANSGFHELTETIRRFKSAEKDAVLTDAIRQKLKTVLSDARMKVDLASKALAEPASRVEALLQDLHNAQAAARTQETQTLDLIAGDHRRLEAFLEEQAAQLRKESTEYLEHIVHYEDVSKNAIPESLRHFREEIAKHVPLFFERRLGEMSELFNSKISSVFSPYNERLNLLTEGIRKKAADLFDINYTECSRSVSLELQRQPYWVTHKWSSSLSPVPEGFFDAFLPAGLRRRVMRKRIRQYITDIVLSNVENLRYATLLNVNATFRRFQSSIRDSVNDTIENTSGIISRALKMRTELNEENNSDISRLQELSHRLRFFMLHEKENSAHI